MSQPKTNSQPQGSRPPHQANGKRRGRRQHSQILASAIITPADTDIVKEDLYNEPTQSRLAGGQEWIRFLEENDSFLKNLMALVNYSPTLRRIIADKANMVVGDGFIPYRSRANTMLTAMQGSLQVEDNVQVLEALEEALNSVNLCQETLADVLHKLAFEYDAFGNCVAEIVRGPGLCYLYHVPLYMVGIRKAGPDQIVRSLGIYDRWEDLMDEFRKAPNLPEGFREVPIYPAWSDADENGLQRTAIHVKQFAPGFFYWGMPEWIAAQFWAEVEYRTARVNIDKLDNGFMPSGVLQFFGSMTQPEAQEMIEAFKAKMIGPGKAFKLFAQVIRDESLKANWVPMTQQLEGEFMELAQLAAAAIVTANRWTASLAGIATPGQLGTNQQVMMETEFLQNTVIKPRQNMLLSRIINIFLKEAGAHLATTWKEVRLGISNSTPVSFMGVINVETSLTRNEKREVLGYEPLTDEQITEENPQPMVSPENPTTDGINTGN